MCAANLVDIVLGVRKFDFTTNHLAEMASDRDKSGPASFSIDRGKEGIGVRVDIVGRCHTEGTGNVRRPHVRRDRGRRCQHDRAR